MSRVDFESQFEAFGFQILYIGPNSQKKNK